MGTAGVMGVATLGGGMLYQHCSCHHYTLLCISLVLLSIKHVSLNLGSVLPGCANKAFSVARERCGMQDVLERGGWESLLWGGCGRGGGEAWGHISFLAELPGQSLFCTGPAIALWARLGLDESSF